MARSSTGSGDVVVAAIRRTRGSQPGSYPYRMADHRSIGRDAGCQCVGETVGRFWLTACRFPTQTPCSADHRNRFVRELGSGNREKSRRYRSDRTLLLTSRSLEADATDFLETRGFMTVSSSIMLRVRHYGHSRTMFGKKRGAGISHLLAE